MTERYEAIIIGSGFGGAISACRLAKKWPGGVLVLERGKRYPLGSFPRTPRAMSNNFWNVGLEQRARPSAVAAIEARGLFDVRNFGNIDVILCAGLGGGSLIYANVFLEPPDAVFGERWPRSCRKDELQPYYRVAKEVLGSRPIPEMTDERRRIRRTEMFQKVARELGRSSTLVDINVFFGNDFKKPLDPGVQDRNRYGALQTSCVYCAECDIGCNYQAKNTLDLNYLYRAENAYRATIRTEHLVDRIVPVNARGEDDPAGDGKNGYRVYYRDLGAAAGPRDALADRVVISAGSLGSTELLLRCRDVFKTLPRLSWELGRHFSGNGDFLGFVAGTKEPAEPNYGPVITQATDFNLFHGFEREHAFILEDASYPSFAAWFVEGVKPGLFRIPSLWRALRDVWARIRGHTAGGPIGYALHDLLGGDLSYHAAVLLSMGCDNANGLMTLRDGWLDLAWPTGENRRLYQATLAAGEAFRRATKGKVYFAMPTWWWPIRKNVSVHPLGGCVLSDTPESGVTSATRQSFGQVHGYANLYVADGAIVPNAVGANPTATIAALSEMVAEGITGMAPTADL